MIFYKNGFQNWSQGKTVCENLGVRLALIETTEEVAFLNSKYKLNEFNSCKFQ
jgi:hypothetical protein